MSGGSTAARSGRVKPSVVIYILVFIIIFIILATSIFIVDQKEQGVVIRFGRFNRLTEPGLHMKLPFGIERKYMCPHRWC
jgi:membrane protease subunit HflK